MMFVNLFFKEKLRSANQKKRLNLYTLIAFLILLQLLYFNPSNCWAESLIEHFSNSIRLNRIEKEKVYQQQLQKINEEIKKEFSRKNITDILNHIENEDLEKRALDSFLQIIAIRKHFNDRIQERLEQKTFTSKTMKRKFYRFYQSIKVDLIPKNLKKWTYLYPIILPYANYLQPKSIRIADMDKKWLDNEKIFKFFFFYLFRKYANLDKTNRIYTSLLSKTNILIKDGLARLSNFFNHDLGLNFFNNKFDKGVFNKESKFFAFDGYIYKYLKNEVQSGQDQTILIKMFKSYCVYKVYCKECNLLEFYNKRKLEMFKDLALEMEHSLEKTTDQHNSYVKLLYYLNRTFPNISAFDLIHQDNKYKFTARQEKSPVLERLKAIWKKIETKEKDPAKAVKMLQYTLGSIYLLPQKEILPANEEYSFDRSGYATYMQDYIAIYNKYQLSK
jgi:hypothetical protein